jgi:hypothetical protein
MLPDKSIVYESVGSPKVSLSRTKGLFDLVIEVDGIAPYRSTTAEERRVGITALNPPTVHAKTLEQAISSGSRAVQAAIFATPGVGFDEAEAARSGTLEPLVPAGELAMVHYRTTRAIRAALRQIDEDI